MTINRCRYFYACAFDMYGDHLFAFVDRMAEMRKHGQAPIRATSLHRVAGAAVLAVCSARYRTRHFAGEPRQGPALPATRLRATSLHRVAELAGGRFTQDRTPTCSRARIASYTVLLAQPAEALVGRGVVETPDQRGEHRQRLRADLAVGLAFLPVARIRARATIITRTLGLRSSSTRRPGPKTFSCGSMPLRDLERAVWRVLWPIGAFLWHSFDEYARSSIGPVF
jgi:hypothetical protein